METGRKKRDVLNNIYNTMCNDITNMQNNALGKKL